MSFILYFCFFNCQKNLLFIRPIYSLSMCCAASSFIILLSILSFWRPVILWVSYRVRTYELFYGKFFINFSFWNLLTFADLSIVLLYYSAHCIPGADADLQKCVGSGLPTHCVPKLKLGSSFVTTYFWLSLPAAHTSNCFWHRLNYSGFHPARGKALCIIYGCNLQAVRFFIKLLGDYVLFM